MTAAEVIRDVRTRLASPAAWTKGFAARTATGNACDPCSPAATCWCLTGAIERELGNIADEPTRTGLYEQIEHALLVELREDRPNLEELPPFNDGRFTSHEDILDILDRAHARSSSFSKT